MRWLLGTFLLVAPAGAQMPSRPAVDTLSMWLVQGTDTVPIGRQVSHFGVRHAGGDSLLVRIIITDALLFGPRIDTVTTRLDTGMPVRYVGATPRGTDWVDIRDGRARGRITGGDGQPMELDLEVPEGTIPVENVDLALEKRLLPLGGVVVLRLLVPALGQVSEVRFRVEGTEGVGDERAWRLRATNLTNALTLWISQRDRTVLRQSIVAPNGVLLLFDRRLLPLPVGLPRQSS